MGKAETATEHSLAFRSLTPFLRLLLPSPHTLSFSSTSRDATLLLRLRVHTIMVKGSKSDKETTYEIRDIVLAKVRGYPPWPGMVRSSSVIFSEQLAYLSLFSFLLVSRSWIPRTFQRTCLKNALITKSRPFTACDSSPEETSKFHVVPILTLSLNQPSSWLVSKDISRLKTHEIEAFISEPSKRSGELLDGYKVALNPTKWEEEQEVKRANAEEEEANAEVDQLDAEMDGLDADGDADADEGVSKSKKRKRESEPKAKARTKGTAKKDKDSDSTKRKAAGKRNGARSKALVESEDDGAAEADGDDDDDAGPSKRAASPPATKKAKKDDERSFSVTSIFVPFLMHALYSFSKRPRSSQSQRLATQIAEDVLE